MSSAAPTPDGADGLPRRRWPVVVPVVGVLVAALVGGALAVSIFRSGGGTGAGGEPTAGPSAPTASSSGATSGSSSSPSGSCGPTSGDLRFDTEMTATDGHAVPYSVSLPADYYSSCEQYPVLFALHGRDQSNATFLPEAERLRAAVDDGALGDVVIVTPDSDGDGRWEGQYDADFVDELLPHVEETYRVLPGAENRLLVGWSMGGHGAFRFAVEHPEMFAAVWSVDGAMSREPTSYLDFLDGVRADQPAITLVGGDLNGDRVEQVVDLFAEQGVTFPYERRPLGHDFRLFVDADRDAGWPTLRWMQSQLAPPA